MHRILVLSLCMIASVALLSRQPRISGANSFAAEARSNAAASVHSAAEPNSPASFFAPANPRLLTTWDAKAAAGYLDQRAAWWMSWDRAQRDHGTFCISCHTAVPYAMARATLRGALGEQAPSAAEQRLIENVTKRVRLWKEVAPFYSDADRGEYKSVESRGTEAVLNALVLASHDAQSGQLSEDGRLALANMWAEQVTSGEQQGAWRWLRFKNEPWEADDSDFYGAALAAIATGIAPGNYRSQPEVQGKLKLLRGYLNRKAADEPVMNRVVMLWAGAKVPGLVEPALERAVLTEVFAKQQADGGWSLPSLAPNWQRHDNTPQDPQSDGYATGLIAFVLEQNSVLPIDYGRLKTIPSPDDSSARLRSALAWLASHQSPSTGAWPSASLNKNEANHISPETARFMNDAATAYAVLALNKAGQ
jgi:squalene-hopene/tetraprenyl-beta-curcumene cyclase